MSGDLSKASLSQIETRWSLVLEAHQGQGDSAFSAQRELVERYAGAVHRYLLRVTLDPDVAGDLAQEFALRFLRGDFHRADPRRGPFRSYVKRSVLNLVIDARRRWKHQPGPLPGDGEGLSAPAQDSLDLDQQFLGCLREEILSRAWERLARRQAQTGQPFFTVLRLRAEHPTLRSHELAAHLTELWGKEVTAGWVRQNLRRAREKFVEFIQTEVIHSLGSPTDEECDEEMRKLGLWAYCRKEPH